MTITFAEFGSGDPALLLNGYAASAADWDPAVRALEIVAITSLVARFGGTVVDHRENDDYLFPAAIAALGGWRMRVEFFDVSMNVG